MRKCTNTWKKELLRLRGSGRGSTFKQLIAFLSGPGGSGKSHVILTVVKYAKEFNKLLQVPFTKQTVVVTAILSVAATTIHGETIHSAALLMTKKNVDLDIIKEWKDTQLLILDEISFTN